MTFDIERVEKIIEAAKRNGLTKVKIKTKNGSLRIELPHDPSVVIAGSASEQSTDATPSPNDIVVKSPMVGFFRAAGSTAAEGDRVQKNTVIGSIEALGLTNELTAGADGILDEILVEDGQPVQYGQAIARIRQ